MIVTSVLFSTLIQLFSFFLHLSAVALKRDLVAVTSRDRTQRLSAGCWQESSFEIEIGKVKTVASICLRVDTHVSLFYVFV